MTCRIDPKVFNSGVWPEAGAVVGEVAGAVDTQLVAKDADAARELEALRRQAEAAGLAGTIWAPVSGTDL